MAQYLRGNSRNAIGHPARLLIAPKTAPLPEKISQLVSVTTYDPDPTYQFVDIGMTRSALTVTNQADANQWDSQQFGRYATLPMNWWATVGSEALEITQDNKEYLMGAHAGTDVSATEKRTEFTADTEFVNYRLAVFGRDRFGLLHASIFPNAFWDGSAIAEAWERGNQHTIPFNFVAYPDDDAISAINGNPLFRIDFDQVE